MTASEHSVMTSPTDLFAELEHIAQHGAEYLDDLDVS